MSRNKIFSNINIWATCFTIILFVIFFPSTTSAATINLFSDKTNLSIGDEFNVDMKIDSGETAINAGQATLKFDPNIVNVTEIHKENSVFNFWLSEPSFDNTSGQVGFIGGSSSGLSGKSLEVLKVKFKVKTTGTISLTLTDSAVTANDGAGTNVLSAVSGIELKSLLKSEINVIKPTIINKTPSTASSASAKPIVSVPLYPNSSNWYNVSSNFLATWNLSNDVVGVSTALNKIPNFDPSVSEGLFDNKSYPPLDDGVWYLHVRFRNNIGWGQTNHYRIAIDTVPPTPFKVETSGDGLPTNKTTQVLSYQSNDQTSGVLAYLISIDGQTPTETDKNSFTTGILIPGIHKVKIVAQDKAGNKTENITKLEILPIQAPVINSVTKDLFVGEGGLSTNGTSLPGITIIADLKDSKNQTVYQTKTNSDNSGVWSVLFDQPLKSGMYYVQIVAQDDKGSLSMPINSDNVKVHERPVFSVGNFDVTYKLFSGLLVILMFSLFVYGMFMRRKRDKAIFQAEREIDLELTSVEQIIVEMVEINKEKSQDWEAQARSNFNLTTIGEHIKSKKIAILDAIENIR